MSQKLCKNKKCQRPLPEGYKYKYCEHCRSERAQKIKKAGIPQYTEEMNEIVDEWDDLGIFGISDKRNNLHKLKKIPGL